MTAQIWFITGSSRGFGRSLTIAALEAGDQVVATARTITALDDLVATYGERIHPVPLDVTDADAANSAVAAGLAAFGRLDVVVNNAGYANIAPVETADDADFRRQFDTNFWGTYHVSRAALPVLRGQGAGIVVQFSSIGGRVGGTPGLGSYQAAKFAVDGLTRVMAAEAGPLGVRFLVVEPSGFATDWAGSSMTIHETAEPYRATVGVWADRIARMSPAGDPDRAAEILVRVVKRDVVPSHLMVGAGAVSMAQEYSEAQLRQANAWAAVSRSADFDQPYPVQLPAEE
jgi:NAD(P)-dependent dehydrogenase (short-subunit alcohol dehydrogenase family)